MSTYRKIISSDRKQDFRVPHLLVNAMKVRKHEICGAIAQSILSSDSIKKSYREIYASQEGQRRINIVYELIIKALQGDLQPILEDQSRTGYLRATQDVPLENLLQIHRIIERSIVDEFTDLYSDSEISYRDLQEETSILAYVSDMAKEAVSKSCLKTKEEIIEKRTRQIEGLYKLRIALDGNLTIKGLTKILISDISNILGTPFAVLIIYNHDRKNKRITMMGSSDLSMKMFHNDTMDDILSRMHGVQVPHLIDHLNKKYYPVNPESIDVVPIGYWLTIPIFTQHHFYGFLNIHQANNRFIGADTYVLLSVVSKIAEAMERERTLLMLRKSQSELRRLTNKVIYSQEEDRKKISAEIHDTIIQKLTFIWYSLLFLEEKATSINKDYSSEIDSLKMHTKELIGESRKIVYGLRPLMLDQLGLQRTIQEHVDMFQKNTSIDVDLSIAGDCSILPQEKQISVFRILQEALENIRKHSKSSNVDIKIKASDKDFSFIVEDYSIENPPAKPEKSGKLEKLEFPRSHFGLMIMGERAKAMGGNLKYNYRRGGGFIVKGNVPFK